MSEKEIEQQPEPGHPRDTLDNARAGYQAAVNIYINEANRMYARFQAMLAISALLVTASVGLVLQSGNRDYTIHVLSLLGPFAGLVVGYLWLLLHYRGDDYMEYYIRSARELEIRYLSDEVKTLDRRHDFSLGNRVSFAFPVPMHRLSWLGKRLSMKCNSTFIVYTFLFIFAVLEGLALERSWRL